MDNFMWITNFLVFAAVMIFFIYNILRQRNRTKQFVLLAIVLILLIGAVAGYFTK